MVCLLDVLIDMREWICARTHFACRFAGRSMHEGDRMGNGTDANNDAGGSA